MGRLRLLALAGAVLLLMGAFGPVVSIPFGGRPSLFELYNLQNEPGFLWAEAVILAVASASAALAVSGRLQWLWLTGGATLIAWIVSYAIFRQQLSQAGGDAEARMGGLAASVIRNIHLAWGAYALLAGCLACLVAAAWLTWDQRRRDH